MVNVVRQEAAHIGLNPDKTESLAISIKQPLAPDYNLLRINLSEQDIEQVTTVRYLGNLKQCWRMLKRCGQLI